VDRQPPWQRGLVAAFQRLLKCVLPSHP
jgi:hypothetical protein